MIKDVGLRQPMNDFDFFFFFNEVDELARQVKALAAKADDTSQSLEPT